MEGKADCSLPVEARISIFFFVLSLRPTKTPRAFRVPSKCKRSRAS